MLAWNGLFGRLETEFYAPSARSGALSKLAGETAVISNYFDELRKSAEASLKLETVRRSFGIRQNDTDIYERGRIFGEMLAGTPAMQWVRFVDSFGNRIHFSTENTDFIIRSGTTAAYRQWTDVPRNFRLTQSMLQGKGGIFCDGENGRFVIYLPFDDAEGIRQGIALFSFGASAVAEKLAENKLASITDLVTPITSPQGFLIGLRGEADGALVQKISELWKEGENTALLYGKDASFTLFTRETEQGLRVGILEPGSLFVLPFTLKIIILAMASLTFFILIFALFNIRQDPVTVVQHRMKKLQVGLLNEYFELKSGMDWYKWKRDLVRRREETRTELLRGFNTRKQTEGVRRYINSFFDRSWDELVSVIGSRSRGDMERLDEERVEDILKKILKATVNLADATIIQVRDSGTSLPPRSAVTAAEPLRAASPLPSVEAIAPEGPAAVRRGPAAQSRDDVEELENIEEVEELESEETKAPPKKNGRPEGEKRPSSEILEELDTAEDEDDPFSGEDDEWGIPQEEEEEEAPEEDDDYLPEPVREEDDDDDYEDEEEEERHRITAKAAEEIEEDEDDDDEKDTKTLKKEKERSKLNDEEDEYESDYDIIEDLFHKQDDDDYNDTIKKLSRSIMTEMQKNSVENRQERERIAAEEDRLAEQAKNAETEKRRIAEMPTPKAHVLHDPFRGIASEETGGTLYNDDFSYGKFVDSIQTGAAKANPALMPASEVRVAAGPVPPPPPKAPKGQSAKAVPAEPVEAEEIEELEELDAVSEPSTEARPESLRPASSRPAAEAARTTLEEVTEPEDLEELEEPEEDTRSAPSAPKPPPVVAKAPPVAAAAAKPPAAKPAAAPQADFSEDEFTLAPVKDEIYEVEDFEEVTEDDLREAAITEGGESDAPGSDINEIAMRIEFDGKDDASSWDHDFELDDLIVTTPSDELFDELENGNVIDEREGVPYITAAADDKDVKSKLDPKMKNLVDSVISS